MRRPLILWVIAVPLTAAAADPSLDVSRLLRERDQRSSELQLRMQQQQERSLRPSPRSAGDFQLRQQELNEQVRQREELELERRERQARDAAMPTDASRAQRANENARH